MANPLYSVLSFTCALVLLIFMNQFKIVLDKSEKTDKDFSRLSNWVTFFCIQDGIWGIFSSGTILNPYYFFISSSISHAAAAILAYIWLSYILNFINIERDKAIPAKILSILLVLFQIVLLVINYDSRFIFDISNEGVYVARLGKNLLYYSQYFTFFVIGLFTAYRTTHATSAGDWRHYATGFLFILAPVLCGLLQKVYPLAPCNSIGSMLGCCTIYAFFISKISRNRDLSQKAVIISALSADYDLVVYVNTAKKFANYFQVSEKFAPLLWEGRNATSLQSFDNFMKRIYVPNEFCEFIEKSTVEKCAEILQSAPYYTIPFLANIDEQIEHCRLKIASDQSNSQAFIIGITSVEQEYRLIETAQKLRKDLQHTKIIANQDPLTGIGSAAAFKVKSNLIDKQIKAGHKIKFAIIECDVNNLKHINDNLGHDKGNEYLQNCCKVFSNVFNPNSIFRIGGDEFVIILYDAQYEKRTELFKKLKLSISTNSKSPTQRVSFAAGMAEYNNETDESINDVLKRADTLMYKDKIKMKQGR